MSDSEAVVEKRRGRPAKDKSEVVIKHALNTINLLFLYWNYLFILTNNYIIKGCCKRTQEALT